MENKARAVYEVAGYSLKPRGVRKYFYNVYKFLLYHDRDGLLQTLDYRDGLSKKEKPVEKYLVFRFMLQWLKHKHPHQLAALRPN